MPEPRTAIYARYSSHGQDGNTSIDVQLESCRRAAGCACREYIDLAVTGKTMDRAAFNRMLADAEAGEIGRLIVYRWDRFGRSAHAHAIVADLEDMGVQVVSATEGAEPLTRGIGLVIAADFSDKLGTRITDAKLRRFREGAWHGGYLPYGYRAEGGRLVIDAGEAEIVRGMFAAYLTGNMGYQQIALDLNARGVSPRRARYWASASIRAILLNPIYVGRPVYHRVTNSAVRRRGKYNRGPGEWIDRNDARLRIVSEEMWTATRQRMGERSTSRPVAHQSVRPLSKLMRCAVCGRSFIRRCGGVGQPVRWQCGGRIKIGSHFCTNTATISEADTLETVLGDIMGVVNDADEIIAEAVRIAEQAVSSQRQESARLADQLRQINREIEHATGLLLDPDLSERATKQALSRKIAELTEQRDGLTGRYVALAGEATDQTERLARHVRTALDDLRQQLAAADTPAKVNHLLGEAVGPMLVGANGGLSPVPGDNAALATFAQGIVRAAVWGRLAA